MPNVADLSDEELLREWEDTKTVATSLRPGVEPPRYTTKQHRRHLAAEAELKRRGFVEGPPGWWERSPSS